jgi:hypothetical protein
VLVGPTDAEQGSVFIGVDPTGGAIGFWQPAIGWMPLQTSQPARPE